MPRSPTAAMLLIALTVAGCASDGGSEPSSAAGTTETAAGDNSLLLLDPDGFVSYTEAHPDVPVINVHIPYEGHIAGTDAFVPFEEIEDWDGIPGDLSDPVVLYCRSGRMSAIAAATLREMGYTEVVDLNGGMNAWVETGFELRTEDPTGQASTE